MRSKIKAYLGEHRRYDQSLAQRAAALSERQEDAWSGLGLGLKLGFGLELGLGLGLELGLGFERQKNALEEGRRLVQSLLQREVQVKVKLLVGSDVVLVRVRVRLWVRLSCIARCVARSAPVRPAGGRG